MESSTACQADHPMDGYDPLQKMIGSRSANSLISLDLERKSLERCLFYSFLPFSSFYYAVSILGLMAHHETIPENPKGPNRLRMLDSQEKNNRDKF